MKIEIWSDIMCPFCYIGKRKFEVALAQLDSIDNIEIEWKSFLLSPDMKTDDTKNIHQFLADHKGISLDEATGMNDNVAHIAANVGLTYNFDKTIPANSFNAHRLLHFAKQHGRQQAAEEALFAAYFTDGKNIDDAQTLVHIAAQLGLDGGAFAQAMGSGAFVEDVLKDINEAQELGIRGVPFFVFDRKYAISGAQDPAAFLETMEKVISEQ
jgi:predicted DsbA family dithiol-disulfide isomerase